MLSYTRFFPSTSVKEKQTVDDLVLADGGQFRNLLGNLAVHLNSSLKDFQPMPFDYFCQTVKLKLRSVNHESTTQQEQVTKTTHWEDSKKEKTQNLLT